MTKLNKIYQLCFLTENRGILKTKIKESDFELDFVDLLGSINPTIQPQWEPPELERLYKRKPLKDYILNTSHQAIISEKAKNILEPQIIGAEFLPATLGNEIFYFLRPPIFHWSEILDSELTLLGSVENPDYENISASKLLRCKDQDVETWKRSWPKIRHYAFLEKVQALTMFRIDASELTGSVYARTIFVTEPFMQSILQEPLEGFEFELFQP